MQNELFEKMPVPRAYRKLALPVVLSSVLTLVYNMVDMFFVARTQNTDLVAGISLCAPVFTLLIALGDILGLGGSSVISRLFGQGKTEDGKRISVFCFWGSIGIGLVFALLLTVFKTPVLTLLGATSSTRNYASQYYQWIAWGAPIIIFSLTPTNLLRTEGLAGEAMIGSVTGSIVNMVLDPVFIFTFGLGAAGAAIATVIGNLCADGVYVYCICKKSRNLSLSLKGFFMTMTEVGAILKIGIPSSITNIMQSIGVTLLNRSLLVYGSDQIAAMGIVSKITMIVVMIMVGFSFGGQPLYGYLYGAGNTKRLKESLRYAYKIVLSIAVGMSVILMILAPQMMRLFVKDATLIQTGSTMLRIVLCGMPGIAVTLVTTCFFQSCGKAGSALALSAGRQGYIYFVILTVLSFAVGYYGVLAAQPVSDTLCAVMAVFLYKKQF